MITTEFKQRVVTAITEDKRKVQLYNDSLHPNQKLHKGKTRMQVFEAENTLYTVNHRNND